MEISFSKRNKAVGVHTEYVTKPLPSANGMPGVHFYSYLVNFGIHFVKKYKFLDRIKALGCAGNEYVSVKAVHKLNERDVRKNNENEFLSFVGNVLFIDANKVILGLPLHGVRSELHLSNNGKFVLGELYRVDLELSPILAKKPAKTERKLLLE